MPRMTSKDGLKHIQAENSPQMIEARRQRAVTNALQRQAIPQDFSATAGPNPTGLPMRLYTDCMLRTSGDTLTCSPTEGKTISVYSGPEFGWTEKTLEADVTLNSAGYAEGKYDIFLPWDNSTSAFFLYTLAWTDDTTRATTLDTVDGARMIYVDGVYYRYIGTGRYTGTSMLVTSTDNLGTFWRGTGDPYDPTGSDPFSGVIINQDGQFGYAAGVLQYADYSATGKRTAGGGNVVLDILGLLFAVPGTFIDFVHKAVINTVNVSTASLMALALETFDQNATDVITNGTAETGNTTGWTLAGTSPVASTDEAHSGTYSFKLADATSTMLQTVGSFSGKHPMAVFWYKGGALQINVEILDAASAQLVSRGAYLPASTTWVKANIGIYNDFSASDKGKISFQATSATPVYVDDIQLLKLDNYAALVIGDAYSTFNDIIRARVRKLLLGNGSASAHAQLLDVRGTSYLGGDVEMAGAINEYKGANIASASTTDIGAATGNYVNVTGTTTITALGTVQAGTRRIVQFTGALTLTYNATSLILPGAANITTAAGDVAEFVSEGSGNWRCTRYTRASAPPVSGTNTGDRNFMLVGGSGANGTVAAGGTAYLGLFSSLAPNATFADVASRCQFTAIAKNATWTTRTTQPAGGSLVFTIQVAGVDSGITATVAAGAAPQVVSDATHTVSTASGNSLVTKIVNNAGAAISAQVGTWTLELDAS